MSHRTYTADREPIYGLVRNLGNVGLRVERVWLWGVRLRP